MKRFILSLNILILLIIIPTNCYAQNYDEYTNSFDLSSFELLDDSTKEFLSDLEIDDFNYENITNISISDFFNYVLECIKSSFKGSVQSGIIVIAFVILSSFFKSFSNELTSENSNVFSTITSLVISIYLINSILDCLGLCVSTIKLCSNFAFAFFPAFFIIITTSGGVATSVSTNTSLLILAQALNYISSYLFVPIINCFLALGICSSLRDELNIKGVVEMFKNIITKGISVLSAGFVSVLSVKTAVASRADALGLRSMRFAINSVIPVIGSSISEGLLSIQSYSSLIKSSVGIVGIIGVFAVFLPSIVEVTVWRITLSVCSLCGTIFSDKASVNSINVFKDALLLMNVILILSMVTTIISIGILVATKTAV